MRRIIAAVLFVAAAAPAWASEWSLSIAEDPITDAKIARIIGFPSDDDFSAAFECRLPPTNRMMFGLMFEGRDAPDTSNLKALVRGDKGDVIEVQLHRATIKNAVAYLTTYPTDKIVVKLHDILSSAKERLAIRTGDRTFTINIDSKALEKIAEFKKSCSSIKLDN